MTTEIKGKNLVITIPMNAKPYPVSKSSGKSLIIASTGGNMITDLEIDGKKMTLGLNAYIKKD